MSQKIVSVMGDTLVVCPACLGGDLELLAEITRLHGRVQELEVELATHRRLEGDWVQGRD